MTLQPGDPAPDFTAHTTQGRFVCTSASVTVEGSCSRIRRTSPGLNFQLVGDDRTVAELYGMSHANALETGDGPHGVRDRSRQEREASRLRTAKPSARSMSVSPRA